MKKTFALLLALIVAATAALSGCSSGTPDNTAALETSAPVETSAPMETGTPETSAPAEAGSETYTYDHMTITLPEGFTVDESGSLPVVYPPDYPASADSITFSKGGQDDPANFTQEILDQAYGQTLAGFDESLSFEQIEISGLPAVVYSYSMTVNDVEMIGTQYFIFGADYTDILTFTSVSGAYDDAFAACANSIVMD